MASTPDRRPLKINRSLSLAFLLLLAATPQSRAQERNAQVLSRMLLDCVAPTVTQGPSLVVNLPDELGFAEPDIAAAFLAVGRSIELPNDSTDVNEQVSLTVRLDGASIDYTRRGRRDVDRTVELRASYIARERNGVVSASNRCTYSETDQLRRSALSQIEEPAWPLTVGDGPGRSRFGRILTPVVAAGAVVVSAYLLFALRSESGSDS